MNAPSDALLPNPGDLARSVHFRELDSFRTIAAMALGLLIPGLLGFCVIESRLKRAWFLVWIGFFGVGATGLSAAMSFGPEHTWAWLTGPVEAALVGAAPAPSS